MREVALLSRNNARGAGRGKPEVTPRYWAFLSYSHRDSATADWLHDALEKYRVPRALVGKETPRGIVPASFAPIFRDRHELAASGDLGHTIREALAGSRCLIVLCSPEAAHSRWTNEEIIGFKKAHPGGCVLAAIVDGEPFASEMKGHEGEECFPPALRQKFDSRGRPTGKRAEPIAADLRPTGDGKQLGLLKIVAGMIGVGLDDLVQREQSRRHRRLTYIVAASLAGMTVTSGLAVFAFDQRNTAREQKREAISMAAFMLGDLRQKLEPIGRLDALNAVGARVVEYFNNQDKSELSDDALSEFGKAVTMMGEMAQRSGDLDKALALYEQALASSTEILNRRPNDPQSIFNQSQNVFWVGAIAYQRGTLDKAEANWREYKRLADRLVTIAPNRKEWQIEPIYADTNLGIVLNDEHHYKEAGAIFSNLLKNVEQLASSDPSNRSYQDQLSEALAWLAQAKEYGGELDEALGYRERQLALMTQQTQSTGADAPQKKKMMVAERVIGRLFAYRGDPQQGLDHFHRSVAIGEELLQTEPNSSEWAETLAGAYLDLTDLQLGIGRTEQAGAALRSGCNLAQRLIDRDSSVILWRGLRNDCVYLRARLALNEGALEEARALSSQALALAHAEQNQAPSANAAFALAGTQLLRGEVAMKMGDAGLAKSQFTAALKAWPANVEMNPRQMTRKLLILEGLGMRDAGAPLAARLATMGYRHPAFVRERQLVRS